MTTKKVLIVYASGFGSTTEVAHVIAELLHAKNFQVEVQSADIARPPNKDETVIIGSAIRYDRWLFDAKAYLDQHQDMLATLKVVYFYSCLTIAANPTTPDSDQIYDSRLLAMNSTIKPIMVGGFAGALNYKVMPWYMRMFIGSIAMSKGLKGCDYRDWSTIRTWINQLANKL
ncbi:flavodoxin domain-containing protein [Vibrio sp. HN007]|jgi:menaquinone-dependent protoporphyrinogen oxidase|uniref:flavodoxin domain-containing protein n=1 Tax=Vibrio iocasae TaxID=3098914 RepID=UPI0035D43106